MHISLSVYGVSVILYNNYDCCKVHVFTYPIISCLIQVGGGKSGKKSIVSSLVQLVGRKLVEFPINSDTDTTELLGGFQQVSEE